MWWVTQRRHSRLVRPKWTSLEFSTDWKLFIVPTSSFRDTDSHTSVHLCSPVSVHFQTYQLSNFANKSKLPPSSRRQVASFIVACTSVHLLNLWSSQVDFLYAREDDFIAGCRLRIRSHQGSKLVIEPVSPERTHLCYPHRNWSL